VLILTLIVLFIIQIGIIGCTGPYAKKGVEVCSNRMQRKYGNRPTGEIVFYGASNFTFWKTLDEDMKPYRAQNHGFGGSTDKLMKANAYRMLYPYKPSVVFIQTGSNDNARGYTLDEIKEHKKELFAEYRKNLPDAQFIIMSGLPLPGRPQFWANIQALNQFLAEYCAGSENLYFIDATKAMTTADGSFRPEYFKGDGIHLNAIGHNAWTQLMHNKLHEIGVEAK
jgi:lysophospholipase L1-like esterase